MTTCPRRLRATSSPSPSRVWLSTKTWVGDYLFLLPAPTTKPPRRGQESRHMSFEQTQLQFGLSGYFLDRCEQDIPPNSLRFIRRTWPLAPRSISIFRCQKLIQLWSTMWKACFPDFIIQDPMSKHVGPASLPHLSGTRLHCCMERLPHGAAHEVRHVTRMRALAPR